MGNKRKGNWPKAVSLRKRKIELPFTGIRHTVGEVNMSIRDTNINGLNSVVKRKSDGFIHLICMIFLLDMNGYIFLR